MGRMFSIVAAVAASFLLSYYLNPLNGFLQHINKGSVFFTVEISPTLILRFGKLVLMFALITFPAALVKFPEERNPFAPAGLIFGICILLAGLVHYFASEKSEIAQVGWYLIMPVGLLPYFLLGFIGGGMWSIIRSKII